MKDAFTFFSEAPKSFVQLLYVLTADTIFIKISMGKLSKLPTKLAKLICLLQHKAEELRLRLKAT